MNAVTLSFIDKSIAWLKLGILLVNASIIELKMHLANLSGLIGINLMYIGIQRYELEER